MGGNGDMKQYFYLDESPMYKEKLLLRMNHDLFKFPKGTSGSYAVFVSRVLGLSYPDYLRFARDILGAEIIGKHKKYPICFFNKSLISTKMSFSVTTGAPGTGGAGLSSGCAT